MQLYSGTAYPVCELTFKICNRKQDIDSVPIDQAQLRTQRLHEVCSNNVDGLTDDAFNNGHGLH